MSADVAKRVEAYRDAVAYHQEYDPRSGRWYLPDGISAAGLRRVHGVTEEDVAAHPHRPRVVAQPAPPTMDADEAAEAYRFEGMRVPGYAKAYDRERDEEDMMRRVGG